MTKQIKEVMSNQVECVSASGTIADAATKMKVRSVGSVPVMKDGDAVGLVTDRDIVVRGVANGEDVTSVAVTKVMSPDVFWCEAEDDLEKAAEIMESNRVRRLLVRDGGKLAGIVSLSDLAGYGQGRVAGRVLSKVCNGPAAPAVI